MIYYLVNIFLSAFLLFQIQPMIAKYILPWFGGTPMVWSTVQMFFQALLTGGYAYAYWLTDRSRGRSREAVHLGLLALAFVQMLVLGFIWASPVTPDASWRPGSSAFPVWEIVKILAISVGPAYFLLSTNSPIIQSWFSRARPGRSPYALYAFSNVGSLLGLLTYPVFVEPNLGLATQGWVWSLGFGLFILLTGYGALRSLRSKAARDPGPAPVIEAGPRPGRGVQAMWLALSAAASLMMLATTGHITQEVAVIPFLWVLPLSLYLLTFIIAFSDERWYFRRATWIVFYVSTLFFAFALVRGPRLGVPLQLLIYLATLFFAALISHSELYRLRPHPAYLTRFYLMVSVGGALGGIFVSLVAPLIFNGFWELSLSLLFTWGLIVVLRSREASEQVKAFFHRHRLKLAGVGVVLLALTGTAFSLASQNTFFAERNFYGVVRVDQITDDGGRTVYRMVHGITVHGLQYQDPASSRKPTAYFTETSGVGLAILNHPRRGQGMRVGVIGMGIGVLASYAQEGDVYRFYEINPAAIRLAKGEGGYFTFLSGSPATIEVLAGDARISMERELENGQSQQYDLLVLDAFSSDSIPVHLIDSEAFDLYLKHLAPDGLLALHITNNYLDLRPVVWKLAGHYGLQVVYIEDAGSGKTVFPSQWMLVARDPAWFDIPAIAARADRMTGFTTDIPLWTDAYNNLFRILR